MEITNWDTGEQNEESRAGDDSGTIDNKLISGGADGTRTRDLQRDRLAF